jgi:hypothetical protein
MKLLTKGIKKKLPKIDEQKVKGGDTIAYVHFFLPSGSWDWYVIEGTERKDDFIFFGLVDGVAKEFGYFSLKELQSIKGAFNCSVERSLFWHPKALKEIAPELFNE